MRPGYAAQNLIGGRILVDDWRIAELGKLGMPVALSASDRAFLAGRCGNQFGGYANGLIKLGHNAVGDLVTWGQTTGQRDYLEFLALHPGYLVLQPFREDGLLRFLFPLARWVEPSGCDLPLRQAIPRGFHTLLPRAVRSALQGDPPGWLVSVWVLTAAAGFLAYVRHRPSRGPFLWILVLLFASVPHLLVVWHGDALDVPRHALLVGVQVHLAFALACSLAGDALFSLRLERRRRMLTR